MCIYHICSISLSCIYHSVHVVYHVCITYAVYHYRAYITQCMWYIVYISHMQYIIIVHISLSACFISCIHHTCSISLSYIYHSVHVVYHVYITHAVYHYRPYIIQCMWYIMYTSHMQYIIIVHISLSACNISCICHTCSISLSCIYHSVHAIYRVYITHAAHAVHSYRVYLYITQYVQHIVHISHSTCSISLLCIYITHLVMHARSQLKVVSHNFCCKIFGVLSSKINVRKCPPYPPHNSFWGAPTPLVFTLLVYLNLT